MARVLFVQPSFQPPGGGNAVAAWMLQALVGEHDVTTLTRRRNDFGATNRFYGTSLRDADVTARLAPGVGTALDWIPTPVALLKNAMLIRSAKRIGRGFDLTVTANNEAEFGRPNIQYVYYPAFLRPRPLDDVRWYHGPAPVLDAYYWIADRLMQMSRERLVASRTLAVSDWTVARFAARYGADAAVETLYPPIPTAFPEVPWASRENGFVCIGRFAGIKRFETIVEIVAGVRRTAPDAHLHIVGSIEDRRYYRGLRARAASLPWVTLHVDLSRRDLLDLIAKHRYGLHAMVDEHFGMAPAEMLCGGCLVWVHDSGGQVEIVGRDPRFTFATASDATRKILAIWNDEDAQRTAGDAMAERRLRFSAERFQARVREIAREVLTTPRDPRSAT